MIANNLDVEDNVSAAATTASSVSFSVNSLMDGQVDEDQNRQDFLAALREWRNAGKQEETQQQQQKIGVSSSPAAKAAERTSMGNDNTAAALHSKRAEHQRVFDNASGEKESDCLNQITHMLNFSFKLKHPALGQARLPFNHPTNSRTRSPRFTLPPAISLTLKSCYGINFALLRLPVR